MSKEDNPITSASVANEDKTVVITRKDGSRYNVVIPFSDRGKTARNTVLVSRDMPSTTDCSGSLANSPLWVVEKDQDPFANRRSTTIRSAVPGLTDTAGNVISEERVQATSVKLRGGTIVRVVGENDFVIIKAPVGAENDNRDFVSADCVDGGIRLNGETCSLFIPGGCGTTAPKDVSDGHPIVKSRNMPSLDHADYLAISSLGGNSALWIVTEDQTKNSNRYGADIRCDIVGFKDADGRIISKEPASGICYRLYGGTVLRIINGNSFKIIQ